MTSLNGNFSSNWELSENIQKFIAGNQNNLSAEEANAFDLNHDGTVDNKDYLFARQDANMDGIIDMDDASIIKSEMDSLQEYLNDKNLFSKEEALSKFDFNSSGKVNSKDLASIERLLKDIKNNITITKEEVSPPMEEENECLPPSENKVTPKDIQKYLAKITDISKEEALAKYDIDGDGKVTIMDATVLQRKESEENSPPIQMKENSSETTLTIMDATKLQKDAQEIQKYLVGLINKDENEALEKYDIDGDGKVTIMDATELQKQALEIQKKIAGY